MKKYPILLTAIAVLLMAYMGCKKTQQSSQSLTPHLPEQPYDYVSALNNAIISSSGNNAPAANPVTNDGATLGRVLFYDPQLSLNNSLSCAGCHKQQYGFADNVPLSTGFQSQKTVRNVLALINPSTKASFFWDGRTTQLEAQTEMPIQNHLEMGFERLDLLATKLAKVSYYPGLFNKAFGTDEITPQRISYALAQFLRSIVSVNSAFDNNQLNAQELRGLSLFADSFMCTGCHTGENFGGAPLFQQYYGGGGFGGGGFGGGGVVVNPLTSQTTSGSIFVGGGFNSGTVTNNPVIGGLTTGGAVTGGSNTVGPFAGIPAGSTYPLSPDTFIFNTSNIGLDRHYSDGGMGALLNDNTLNGYFIIPSLRNLGLTAPYMHDGRYATLEDVVEHYNSGIQPHLYLDPRLTQIAFAWRVPSTSTDPVRFNMTAQEKADLVAFLKSLTDYSITSEPRYSDPFK